MVRDIRPALLGRRIDHAFLSHTDVLRGVTRRKLLRALTGATVRDVTRRAKHGVIHFDHTRLVMQPGMTGNLLVYRRPLSAEEARYAVLRARLDGGVEFVYRDVRRIGTLRLLGERAWQRYDASLGPEPLDPTFSVERFTEALCHSRAAIKKVLMDQRKIVGVGNIYANEALFAAGIDPSKPANRLSADAWPRLYLATRRILEAAIASQGTTLRDYRTGTGQPGNFQLELLAYERAGEPCRRCGTRLTGTHDIDARITVFCHRCQR